MTSHTSLKDDLPKIRKLSEWLTQAGYSEKIEGEYSVSFTKDAISVTVSYGRHSDLADVFVTIDDQRADRYANGKAYRYSIFEFALVDGGQLFVDRRNDYETTKIGLDLLRSNSRFFEMDFLKGIRTRYLELLEKRLPKNLKNLG